MLQRAPDMSSWHALCEQLDLFPTEQLREEVIPYVSSHVNTWPDVVRSVPWFWLQGVFRGVFHPGLELVRVLDVRGRKLRQDQMEALASAPFLEHVRHVYVQDNKLGPGRLRTLLSSPYFTSLHALYLDGNSLGDDGAQMLGSLKVCAQLEELSIERNMLSDEGLRLLFEGSDWPVLRMLEVGKNRMGRSMPDFQRWAGANVMSRLVHLGLGGGLDMTPTRASVLATSGLGSLKHLDVRGMRMEGDALEVLLATEVCVSLESLLLNWNQVGVVGARHIAARAESRTLRMLDLRRNMIGDEGAKALAASKTLSGLESLLLAYNGVGEEGWHALETAPWTEGVRIQR